MTGTAIAASIAATQPNSTDARLLNLVAPAIGVSPMSFLDLDSRLKDCDLTFDELSTRSPFCKKAELDAATHQLCERFSYNQFPEVLSLKVVRSISPLSVEFCSATLITPDWALTAAHCFLGDDPTNSFSEKSQQGDLVWRPSVGAELFEAAVVDATNAALISSLEERRRRAIKVVVYGKIWRT